MTRVWPRSLAGQMALLIGVALLLAQIASFGFLLVQRQQFNRAAIDTPAVTRFVSAAADYAQADPAFRPLVLSDESRRGAHFDAGPSPAVPSNLDRRSDTEERLRQSLAAAGVGVTDVRAALQKPIAQSGGSRRHFSQMILSARLAGGQWLNGRLSVPAQPPLLTAELWIGTLLLYLFVLSATLLIAVRIARPIRRLTSAAESFGGRNDPVVVEPSGPADVREAILAFNAMNDRIVTLLEEKDRTLGAIGHDLRTPLASLRIRAENVEPEEERASMIRTIEEMAAMLEDLLVLARSGRSREAFEEVDLTGLVSEIVQQYRDAGRPVEFRAGEQHRLAVQPNLLRRAVRNLIDNALNYAGSAEVEVNRAADGTEIRVLDRGPGIPAETLDRVTGAFFRGEPSRNRSTGGAGLGLAIAQSIVDAHGGSLRFGNRGGGGLAAAIVLP